MKKICTIICLLSVILAAAVMFNVSVLGSLDDSIVCPAVDGLCADTL